MLRKCIYTYLDGEVCCTTNGEILDLISLDHYIFEYHFFVMERVEMLMMLQWCNRNVPL